MRTVLKLLAATLLLGALLSAPAAATPITPPEAAPNAADACYTWDGTLQEGASGEPVRQLQIRVAGYADYGTVLALDGDFGPATKAAVAAFQDAYGLTANGVADAATFDQVYALQDDDCTPVNFDYSELNGCNSDWSGGAVSADQAKANALVSMWKLQALRHAMGDQAITVSSGFRSHPCNDAVGGASDSRHLYGDAVDLTGVHSLCSLAQEARSRGFAQILGPGYPGHDDHVHVAHQDGQYWDAPSCGV